MNIDHDFQRTIPADGRWCQRCGLAEALWMGEPCLVDGAVAERDSQLPAVHRNGDWTIRVEWPESESRSYLMRTELIDQCCQAVNDLAAERDENAKLRHALEDIEAMANDQSPHVSNTDIIDFARRRARVVLHDDRKP